MQHFISQLFRTTSLQHETLARSVFLSAERRKSNTPSTQQWSSVVRRSKRTQAANTAAAGALHVRHPRAEAVQAVACDT